MDPQSRISALAARMVMFAAMLALIVYLMHFVLPGPVPSDPEDVVLNPALQVGLCVTLGLLGALVGFWITFGDLVNRGER